MNWRHVWAVICLLQAGLSTAWASDVYNPNNNQLSIARVQVDRIIYTDVLITVGTVIRVLGGTPVGTVYTYNPQLNQLSIPAVMVGPVRYTNVTITVGQVLRVGGQASSESADDDAAAMLVISTMN